MHKIFKRVIGNDIVDLHHIDANLNTIHSRFIQRVFTLPEQNKIEVSQNKKETIWSLWAAKESAFKAISQINPSTIFIPKEFEVSDDWQSITHHGNKLFLKVTKKKRFIHSLCTSDGNLFKKIIVGIDKIGIENHCKEPSIKARSLLKKIILNYFPALQLNDLEILQSQNNNQIPLLIINSLELKKIPITFSHHGRFVASAALVDGIL